MNRRLEPRPPETLTAEQLEFYNLFATGPRAAPDAAFSLLDADGALTGPPSAWLLAPPVANALERLGAAIRFGLTLTARECEAAILTVAYSEAQPFELHAHLPAARKAGWTAEDLEDIREGRDPEGASAGERAALAVARRLVDARTLDDTEYAIARDELGERRLFELVTLVGYYRMMALQLNVFAIDPPSE